MNVRRTLARVVLGAALFAAAPLYVRNLWRAAADVHRFPLEASTRDAYVLLEGEQYENEMDRIRAAVPPDGAYVVVGSSDEARINWIRYELAPRRAWLAGDRRGTRWVLSPSPSPRSLSEWTVLAGDEGQPPRLVPTTDLYAHGLRPKEGDEDSRLPGFLDEPATDANVKSPVTVRGWCEETGSRPCRSVTVFLDGNAVELVARVSRPDVAEAIPAMGDSSRAGFEAHVANVAPGVHEISALFVGQSGRWRRVGPWRFRCEQ